MGGAAPEEGEPRQAFESWPSGNGTSADQRGEPDWPDVGGLCESNSGRIMELLRIFNERVVAFATHSIQLLLVLLPVEHCALRCQKSVAKQMNKSEQLLNQLGKMFKKP